MRAALYVSSSFQLSHRSLLFTPSRFPAALIITATTRARITWIAAFRTIANSLIAVATRSTLFIIIIIIVVVIIPVISATLSDSNLAVVNNLLAHFIDCLLYTSDAADE